MTTLAATKPSTRSVEDWLERFREAWQDGDAGAWIEDAFTEDALLRHHPLRPAHRGHDEIRTHLRRAAAILGDAQIRIARPVVDGDRAAAEWWAETTDGVHAVTLAGAILLRFARDGRVSELRRYGDMHAGSHPPHAGWTTREDRPPVPRPVLDGRRQEEGAWQGSRAIRGAIATSSSHCGGGSAPSSADSRPLIADGVAS